MKADRENKKERSWETDGWMEDMEPWGEEGYEGNRGKLSFLVKCAVHIGVVSIPAVFICYPNSWTNVFLFY